jgi:hypothetical protein
LKKRLDGLLGETAMTTAERIARALLERIGYRVETPAEKHARKCGECLEALHDPTPVSEAERRRHRSLVLREMARAAAKRQQQ